MQNHKQYLGSCQPPSQYKFYGLVIANYDNIARGTSSSKKSILCSLKLTMMMILISFHSTDSYSALHHKCAWFQDFADMFSTCNLWLRKYGVAWCSHNVNKLFIENMFDFFKSTIGIFE